MKCHVCGTETREALSSQLFERGERAVVVRHIPSHICPQCGETYRGAAVTRVLLQLAEAALTEPPGAATDPVAVREYKAA